MFQGSMLFGDQWSPGMSSLVLEGFSRVLENVPAVSPVSTVLID